MIAPGQVTPAIYNFTFKRLLYFDALRGTGNREEDMCLFSTVEAGTSLKAEVEINVSGQSLCHYCYNNAEALCKK